MNVKYCQYLLYSVIVDRDVYLAETMLCIRYFFVCVMLAMSFNVRSPCKFRFSIGVCCTCLLGLSAHRRKKISVTEGKEEMDRTSCPYPCPNLSPSYVP